MEKIINVVYCYTSHLVRYSQVIEGFDFAFVRAG